MEKIKIIIDIDLIKEYEKYYFNKNPRAKKFYFKNNWQTKKKNPKYLYGCLSLNELLIINNRMSMNNIKKQWGLLGEWIAEKYGLKDKNYTNAIMQFTVYSETRSEKDDDNLAGGIKFLNDGLLVKSGAFIDDNYKHLNPLIIKADYDKDHPRTEIDITLCENIVDETERLKLHFNL